MTIKNLQPSIEKLPHYVKEGIKKGQKQARNGLTKSTEEVMQKYPPAKQVQ